MINGPQVVHLIAAGCKRSGITLNTLYRKSGLHLAQHFKWMHGKASPAPGSVAKLQRGLLHSAAALMGTAFTLRRVAQANEQAAASILDDTFGMCAMVAFAELYQEHNGPPPSEAVKRRAYALYEEELAREKEPRNQPATEE